MTGIIFQLVAVAATAVAAGSATGFRAADGALYWRTADGEAIAWEWADTDADGKVDVAIRHAGAAYARVAIDTDADGRADRVYLYDRAGEATGYLDPDGDGVLTAPQGGPAERERELRATGRGERSFSLLHEMRYLADAGELAKTDAAVPATDPAPGDALTLTLRLTLLPGAPLDGGERTGDPMDLGEYELPVTTGRDATFAALPVGARRHLDDVELTAAGTLAAEVFPVWIESTDERGRSRRRLMVQFVGRLAAAGLDEPLFFSTHVPRGQPATVQIPLRDATGRPRALMVEIGR